MRFIHAADIHLGSLLHGLERYEGAPIEEIRGVGAYSAHPKLAFEAGLRHPDLHLDNVICASAAVGPRT